MPVAGSRLRAEQLSPEFRRQPVGCASRSKLIGTAATLLLQLQATAGADYVHSETYVGSDFFSKWDFFTGADPTHGTVEYVSFEVADEMGLVKASEDQVFIGVDMTSMLLGGGRRSVRIQSKTVYNAGLFVLTLDHVPTGCGSWPAFWMFGYDAAHEWPELGEFDIIESIHRASQVQSTLHTTQGCSQAGVNAGGEFTGTWAPGEMVTEASNCWTNAPGQFEMQGCVQQGPEGSIGESFNANHGGTFAAEWDPAGERFRIWFWPRGSEPADLLNRRPLPDSWGKPYSYFSLSPEACPVRHFANMHLVFDITFCGDLGNPHWKDSCPELAGHVTCEDFVRANPEKLREVFWSIRTLDTYLPKSMPGTGGFPGPGVPSPRSYFIFIAVACLLLSLTVGACYILERLQNPQDRFPGGRLRESAPRFWEAMTNVAARLNPSCLVNHLCQMVGNVKLGPQGAWQWQAIPLHTNIGGVRSLQAGDPVIVRTPFVATGKYFGQKALPPRTPGVVEELLHSGGVVVRFAHFWGASVVQPNQLLHLDTPTEDEITRLHASMFSKRGKAIVML